MQQIFLGLGSVVKKTYVDDVFSTFLYAGNESNRSFNNGIDLSGEGGMTWIKERTNNNWHQLFDTERGAGKRLASNVTNAEATDTTTLSAFNNNGFSIGTNDIINDIGDDYSSWSFRKAPGFFDIVTWNGDGSSNRNIPHNLGVVPGAIWIKRRNANEKWVCWHRDSVGSNGSDFLVLNSEDGQAGGPAYFGTSPVMTSTTFEVNSDNAINQGDMIAYVFAGGGVSRPPQTTNVYNVSFNGTSHVLNVYNTTQANFGTNDFTVEFWATPRLYSNSPYFLDFRENGSATGTTDRIVLYIPSSTGKPTFWLNGSARIEAKVPVNLGTSSSPNWQHYALVRSSGTTTFYIDGIAQGTYSDSTNYTGSGSGKITIGNRQGGSQYFKGQLCDLRITKGQALYTENFNVPATALTTTSQGATSSNVTLLCLQNSSVTTSTAGTNPFGTGSDDTQGPKRWAGNQVGDFVFGGNEDQNLIKCGKYIGNGSESDGTEVHVGFEPQWLLVKRLSSAHWGIIDTMREWVADGQADVTRPNISNADANGANSALPTPTGFKLHTTNNEWNGNGDNYIYIAIRRPDGYVGKPPELGTGVFAMDTGNNTSYSFDAGFPVDMGLYRRPSSTESWYVGNRLMGGKELQTNLTSAEFTANNTFDSNTAWANQYNSTYQSWMWKRHAGFDVVTYKGVGPQNLELKHGLGQTPEMIWVKGRNLTASWQVYHNGVNGGTNPQNYYLELNQTYAQDLSILRWNNTAPTSTHFTVGSTDQVNGVASNNYDYIAFLFASVEGISKVGYYTGTGNNQSVTTGFQPRFILIKRTSYAEDWFIFDSLRGLVSGSPDPYLRPNENAVQTTTASFFDISSTGFTVTANFTNNANNYIYYAHA